jgi:hypothetical protein
MKTQTIEYFIKRNGENPPSPEELMKKTRLDFMSDIWPHYLAVEAWGIETPEHYGLLRYLVLDKLITDDEWLSAYNKPSRLNEFIPRLKNNPFPKVVFKDQEES